MRKNFTKNSFIKNVKLFMSLTFLSLLLSGLASAQTYINGNLGTGTTASTGAAAPAGFQWHELQTNVGGAPVVANASLAFAYTGNFTVADNFTVPAGETWNISGMTFYAIQPAAAPITALYVRIHSSSPLAGATTVVYGDLTTNRLGTIAPANMYGIFNATPATTYPIQSMQANVTTSLTAGTYWLEWKVAADAATFAPTSVVVGSRSQPSYNAIQSNLGAWTALVDAGTPAGTSVPQDLPFRIAYTATGSTACTGTPAPGNTVASATSVCPGILFNLSLQNATTGAGVTYQWQRGTSATGPWTDIIGATLPTLTYSLSTSTYYRAVVTCGANSGSSTPVQVTASTGCYCTPGAVNCSLDDQITNVTLGTLNNNSGCGAGGYTNYTTNSAIPVPDVVQGGANPMRVTVGPGGTEFVGVWVDYNKNGTFETTEFQLLGSANGATIAANLNVPASAPLGQTRMRVRVQYNTAVLATQACAASSGFGEVEDYNVNIVPCVPATITTQPVNRSIVCGANTTFSVVVAGSLPVVYWEYRPNATAVWQNVPATAPFSTVNTNTLTLTNVPVTYNGYQFRAVYQGACTGVDFSSAVTLTVAPYVATVNPASASICLGSTQQLSITNTLGDITVWTENFDALSPLPTGWARKNNSQPLGPQEWQAGNPTDFTAFNGAPASYLMALWSSTTTTGSGTISNWLFTPQTTFKNGDQFKFYTRTAAGSTWADRMEVRISTAGASTNVGTTATSVGDFTTVLLTINQTLAPTGYPQTWTEYTATVSGVTGSVSGRAAFRYFVTDGGGDAPNSNVVGLDNVRFIQTGAVATGVWTGPAGTMYTDAGATTAYTGTAVSSIYVKPTVSGVNNYSVVVTTPTPCVSGATTIPVSVMQLPSAVSATANQTTCENGNATFTSTVTGGFTSGLQWQVSTDNGASYSNVANSSVYGGATTTTLTITGATTSMNNNRYRLVAAAAPCAGTVTSTAGTLTVNPLPVLNLTANPFTAIYPGQTTTLAVASTTTVPANGYVWYRNGVVVPGATGNTLVVDVDALGQYTVSVADANGCGNAVPASITITAAPNDILFIYPSPNTGQFQIRYQSSNGNNPLPRVVNVYDSKGARVYSRTYTVTVPYSRMDVDMSGFQKGIYQVELADRNGNRLKTGRVVIL